MAAHPVPAPAAPPIPCSGPSWALRVGLVGLFAGGALLVACEFLPVPASHAIEVPRASVNRAAHMRFGDGQDAAGSTKDPSLRFTARTQLNTNHHVGRATTNERNREVRPGLGSVRSDLNHKARRPRSCFGDRAESPHLATVPVCQNPRDALTAMATAQYRGFWSRWDGTDAVATQAASDDRIASDALGRLMPRGSNASGIRKGRGLREGES